MDILGIGPLELILVLVLALLIFGPEDLVSSGKKMGQFFNKLVKSETWKAIRSVSRELRALPNKLAREAELEELTNQLKEQTILPPIDTGNQSPSPPQKPAPPSEDLTAWTTPPSPSETNQEPGDSVDMAGLDEDANENTSS